MGVDSKEITSVVPDIVVKGKPKAASDLALKLDEDMLAEACVLFNTAGLTDTQKKRMVAHIFKSDAPKVRDALAGRIANCCARIGTYNFSFPLWRFLAQSYGVPSLLEEFGMMKLKRDTDVRDAALPDPARDELGVGYAWMNRDTYIEYRRSYVLCARTSGDDAGVLAIRNSSYFYGRDRLKHAAYFSTKSFAVEDLLGLKPKKFGGLAPLQDMLSNHEMPDPLKVDRLESLLFFLDGFDKRLHAWLYDPAAGLPHLVKFLRAKLELKKGGMPVVGWIKDGLPPWKVIESYGLTAGVINAIANGGAFDGMPADARFALLSGAKGDFPVF